jgi:hypothetical protein
VSFTPIYVNRRIDDDDRRFRIFEGAFFLYPASRESLRIIQWIRTLAAESFEGVHDLRRAHEELAITDFVERVSKLKSRFTNHSTTKQLCQELIKGVGSDPATTYFDLPRLRIAPPGNYLTTGVSYAYKPHRDTWYAHPRQLINYWVPVYDSEPTAVMSMYVDCFNRPIQNASVGWDYDDWVKNSRFAAASNIGVETRRHPVPLQDLHDAADVRIVQNAGDLMLFSTCQLHATAPNNSGLVRFSYDLRTVNIEDLRCERGPKNIDAGATGSTLRDFLRVSDLAPFEVSELQVQ